MLTIVAAWQAAQLNSLARRKVIPFGRHAEARAAIFGKSRAPPMAAVGSAQKPHTSGVSQRTLQQLWSQPNAVQEIAIDDMES